MMDPPEDQLSSIWHSLSSKRVSLHSPRTCTSEFLRSPERQTVLKDAPRNGRQTASCSAALSQFP